MGSHSVAAGLPEPSPVIVSVVGAGAWARTAHLAALSARADVVLDSVFDPDDDRARATAQEFGFAHVASSLDDLLSRPGHACVIASPAARHAEQAIAALEADRHVLIEKPMTNSAESAWRIVALSQSRERQVMLALGWNYSPLFVRAAHMLAAAPLGELEHVALHMASGTHPLLTGESSDSSGRIDRPAISRTWTDPALSGGGYGNAQLSHALGVLFGLVDEGVGAVSAAVRPGAIPGIELSLALAGVLEGGATLSISGTSIRQPIRQQLDLRLFGSEGQLHLDFRRDLVVRIDSRGDAIKADLAPDAGAYPGTAPANAFVDLLTGRTSVNSSDAVVGARSTDVLDAVRAVA